MLQSNYPITRLPNYQILLFQQVIRDDHALRFGSPLVDLRSTRIAKELLAALGVRGRRRERGLGDAERLRGDGNPPAVERPQRERKPAVHVAEDGVAWDRDVEVEIQAPEPSDAERIRASRSCDPARGHR